MKTTKLPLTDVKAGQTVLFTVTNTLFKLAKVTDARVSWYTTMTYRSYKNTMKMAWVSRQQFERSLLSGAYKIQTP